jgi:hypothetical protein
MMDRETNTLAAHGLEDFFSSYAVLSVFQLWGEIVLGVTYLPYQLCRCVFFWLRWEIVLGCTDQFFGCGGKMVLGVTYLPTIPVVPLCQFFGCGGK